VLVGGRSLLGHVLDRLPAGVPVAVVGPERPDPADAGGGDRTVLTCREDPPGGGPAAAVAEGLAALERAGLLRRLVVVVPADAPRAAEVLPRLLDALRRGGPAVTAAVALDGGGRRQVLVAAHDAAALRERVRVLAGAAPVEGSATRGSLSGLPAARLLPPAEALVEVVAPGDVLADVDTPEDLAAARALARGAERSAARRAGGGPPA
jgi:molybdopterin-guanine dinucleotide biosynthesis protein A